MMLETEGSVALKCRVKVSAALSETEANISDIAD